MTSWGQSAVPLTHTQIKLTPLGTSCYTVLGRLNFYGATTMAEDKRKSRDNDIDEVWALLRDSNRILKEHIAEAKKDKEEAKKRSRKIDAQIEELGKQIGGAHNRWGKIVEELVAGDLTAIISTHLNGQAHYLSTRVRPDDRSWEIDVLATNGDIAVPAEVKTTLSIDSIDKFVSRILIPFTTLLPDHKHKRIYGVIAFVKTDGNEHEVIDHALSQGLIVVKAVRSTHSDSLPLSSSYGTNKVLNAKDFKPRNFCPRRK